MKSILLTPMITDLPILGDTCFKFTNTSRKNQNSIVSLRCAYSHVFDKVFVSQGINDGHILLAGLKFLQGDVNGDTTYMFSFQYIPNSDLFEGALSNDSKQPPSQIFLWFFVDLTTYVAQMASGGRLALFYIFSDDDIAMSFFFPILA